MQTPRGASDGALDRDALEMTGANTGDDELEALTSLFADAPVHLNLIDVNDARSDGYRPPDAAERDRFRDRLRALGLSSTRRYSGGSSRHAACGMLANVRACPER